MREKKRLETKQNFYSLNDILGILDVLATLADMVTSLVSDLNAILLIRFADLFRVKTTLESS